jgi:SAM-dependent methyltransferase
LIAEASIRLASLVAGERVTGATGYWRERYWNREELEADPGLGGEYAEERARIGGLISEAAKPGVAAVDMACGTGVFSAILLSQPIRCLESVDVSPQALTLAGERIGTDARACFVEADFWSFEPQPIPDLIVCVDALHHLGMPEKVLRRIKEIGRPGTRLIANYWTKDHFHEFSRIRHGRLRHGLWSLCVLSAAFAAKATGSHPGQLRTTWQDSPGLEAILRSEFENLHYLNRSRYFLTFAAIL